MLKRSQIYALSTIAFAVLSCAQQQGKSNAKSTQDDSTFRDVLFMKNLGEPTGAEIKSFDFYLVLTYFRQYHPLSIYSIRFKKNNGAAFYRVIDSKYPAVLQNEYQLDTAVMFKSYYRNFGMNQLEEIRRAITNFDFQHSNEKKGNRDLIISEGEYQLLIYNRGQVLSIFRADTLETNIRDFIRNLQQKYFSSFPIE